MLDGTLPMVATQANKILQEKMQNLAYIFSFQEELATTHEQILGALHSLEQKQNCLVNTSFIIKYFFVGIHTMYFFLRVKA